MIHNEKETDMLHANEPALQVKTEDGTWAYVFCYMHNRQDPITCQERNKALNARRDLAFFADMFGHREFRAEA